MVGEQLSILVLTEDSSSSAEATLEALSKKMVRLVDPCCKTQSSAIRFEPADDRAKSAARANRWKSRQCRDQQASRALIRTITNHLLQQSPPGFVFFHFDGDRPWSERAHSENLKRFGEVIEGPVLAALRFHCKQAERDLDESAPETKLIRIVPFYSIEAWLLQNTRAARRLLKKTGGCRQADSALLDAWKADPSLLDELSKPKEQICLGARFNKELASSAFPAKKVERVRKSFALVVDSMRACQPLVDALRTTWEQQA